MDVQNQTNDDRTSRAGGTITATLEPSPATVSGVQGLPTTHLDIAGHRIYSALPTPTDSLPLAAAREARQALALIDATTTGRMLIVEPFTDSLLVAMRQQGYTGECVSWARTPRRPEESWRGALDLSDQVYIGDWLDHQPRSPAPLNGPKQSSAPAPAGRFQLIVALELTRLLPPERLPGFLQWLASLLAPLGFLIVGEPAEVATDEPLPLALASVGLAQTADARQFTADWSWRLTRWQLRSGAGSHREGVLQPITYAEMQANPLTRNAVVTAYREVFGGDEWGEWMYCPVCARQYSKRDYETLSPPNQCVCDARARLEVYHTQEDVVLQARGDLANARTSRLYARWGQDQASLDAFIWGYLAQPAELAQSLLPRQGDAEQQRFQHSLAEYLAGAGITDPTPPIYHQAYIGAIEQSRNFGLVRAMFTRVCQFAIDQHAPVMVTATIPSVNAFALLRGIGMEVIYTYPSPTESAPDASPPPMPKPAQQEKSLLLSSRLDEQVVILAGKSWSILSAISRASDRGLEVLVARTLRQMRSA